MRNGDEVNPSDALRQHPLSHDGLNGSHYIEKGNSRGQNGLCWRDSGSKRDAPERLQKDTDDRGEVPGTDIDCIERCDSMVMASTDFLTPDPLAVCKFGSRPFMTVSSGRLDAPHCGDVTFTSCADKNVDQSHVADCDSPCKEWVGAIKGYTTEASREYCCGSGIFAERPCMFNGISRNERSRHDIVDFSMRHPRSLAAMSSTTTEFSDTDRELSSLDTLCDCNSECPASANSAELEARRDSSDSCYWKSNQDDDVDRYSQQ